jgi:Na+/citrate or Na+/malate symporter
MSNVNQTENTGFKELLNSMMKRRWFITAIVLLTFLMLTIGIVISIHMNTNVGQEWKELLLLMLGAFIGSYGKIIDYWFSDTDKDKMLVQKMDEEDGVSLSNTLDSSPKSTE